MIKSMIRINDWSKKTAVEIAKKECKKEHPPFTAEKQLKLIKWLGELEFLGIMRTTKEDKAWIIRVDYGITQNIYVNTVRDKFFDECLAKLVNRLWQGLTEKEKEQVREILE